MAQNSKKGNLFEMGAQIESGWNHVQEATSSKAIIKAQNEQNSCGGSKQKKRK